MRGHLARDVFAESEDRAVGFDRLFVVADHVGDRFERVGLLVGELQQYAADLRVALSRVIVDVARRLERGGIRLFVRVLRDVDRDKAVVTRVELFIGDLGQSVAQSLAVLVEDAGLVLAVEIVGIILEAAREVVLELFERGAHVLARGRVGLGVDLALNGVHKALGQLSRVGHALVDILVALFLFGTNGTRLEFFLFGRLLFFGLFLVGRTLVRRLLLFELGDQRAPALFKRLVGLLDAISALVDGEEILRLHRGDLGVGDVGICLRRQILFGIEKQQVLARKRSAEILQRLRLGPTVVVDVGAAVLDIVVEQVALEDVLAHILVVNGRNDLVIVSFLVDGEQRAAREQRRNHRNDQDHRQQFFLHCICSLMKIMHYFYYYTQRRARRKAKLNAFTQKLGDQCKFVLV